jgi:lycopene cyclase domain-containing protein
MSYFEFLAFFLGIPLLLLALLTWWDAQRGKVLPARLRSWPPALVILTHVLVAVLYTTPWDNYLVATGVWWYDPELVTGLVLGWVPIEEYTFFVLQTWAMGLWVVWLGKRLRLPDQSVVSLADHRRFRWLAAGAVGIIWLCSTIILFSAWTPGRYLGLILSWALLPVSGQMAIGADILWRYRRLIVWALAPATIYLGVADALAIQAGTWVIDPAQSTGLLLGALPLEEGLFFLITNLLVVFGMVLVLAAETQQRAPARLLDFRRRLAGRQTEENLLHV